ncbi:MAG: hypothetical protein PHW10_02270 [Candidatus Peribacteraceae bacterium]|nr:hypothetical protein [Candidatus Peribacteraceae bacterium]
MFAHLKKWPKWLKGITVALATLWVLRMIPLLMAGFSCSFGDADPDVSCGLLWLSGLVSALGVAVILAAGWLAFFLLAFEGKRADHEWKTWLWTGAWFGIATAALGASLTARFYITDTFGTGTTPPGLLSASFLLTILTLFVYGFLLGIWFAFPIHWALRIVRRPQVRPLTKGAIFGGALGIPYSILSLVVIPFLSVFGVFAQWFSLEPGSAGYLLSYLQPLMFYFLPQTVLQATPFSPTFNQLAGPVEQLFNLPLFLLFNTVAHVLLLMIVGLVIGWIIGMVKKPKVA